MNSAIFSICGAMMLFRYPTANPGCAFRRRVVSLGVWVIFQSKGHKKIKMPLQSARPAAAVVAKKVTADLRPRSVSLAEVHGGRQDIFVKTKSSCTLVAGRLASPH